MRTFIILLLLTGCMVTGCQKKEYLYQGPTAFLWLGTRNVVNVGPVVDSAISSFALKPGTVLYDTVYIQANLNGEAALVDRPFRLEVVTDSTNVSPSDYILGATVLPAHASTVRVPVIVKRTVQGLDLNKQKAQLFLRFIPDEHFQQGVPGDWIIVNPFNKFRVIWFNFLAPPPTWPLIQSVTGPFTQAKYRFIIMATGYTEFSQFQSNFLGLMGFQSGLRKALNDYNSDPANAGRSEGWPYLDDNGTPLKF